MRATTFEFKARFWIIGIIYWIGFFLYCFDKVNFGIGLLRLAAPGMDPDSARGEFWLRVIFFGGALLVFLAAMLRTWATAYLRTEVVHDAGLHSEALVADGPYRYLRNPLYFANFPMAAGVGVMASRLGWIFLVAAMWIFHYRLILCEEDELLRSQGESYRAYLRAVPRWWPSLTPRVPSAGRQPRWGQAFAGELFVWLFGAGVTCFAVTLDIKPAVIFIAVGLILYMIVVTVIKKHKAQESA
ncbi:MAG: methyltransferase family protein [Candidatus Acidiferrales bacterium]